ncbi:hypothetical protein IFM89_028077 [Coptis chinensis]|uniref:Reticulon-like protein n=1 Tax=Coptis chinensis TaxID=261450 RepID=A0A835HG30_9MAGN|nr:hypothetical protein IFM89_028077 [Coptis chinensis]
MHQFVTYQTLSDSRSGSGGVIRDHNGDVVLAYSGSGGMRSVLFQELKAILQGLNGCLSCQITRISVASDSLRAIMILIGREEAPCELIFIYYMDHQRLFNRLDQILGESLIADVMLWRRREVTVGILLVTVSTWLVFEKSGYTLLSLVSNVFLLLFTILFLWAKSAQILNRPAPPLPDLQLSEDVINEAAAFIRAQVNTLLAVSRDVTLGKDSKLFFKVAACMWLISVVGGWTDLLTLGYTSVVVLLTVPALYQKYEDQIDKYVIMAYKELQRFYVKLDAGLSKIRTLILEKRKLC